MILFNHLRDEPPQVTITSKCADFLAVCWNWVLMGGGSSVELDPKWAYLYVTQQCEPLEAETIERRVNTAAACQRWLGEARNGWSQVKAFPSARKQDEIHILILRGLLAFHEFVEDETSPLKVVLYYTAGGRSSGLMYVHMELVFRDAITLTKGLEADVKAFNGASVVAGDHKRSVSVGISMNNLKPNHVAVLRDFQRQIEAGTAAKSKKQKAPEEKEFEERGRF